MNPAMQNDLVSVIGQASVAASPDLVVVTLAVERTAETGSQAIAALNAATMRVVQTLTQLGVPQTDLNASQPAVCPIYLHSSQVVAVKPWDGAPSSNGSAAQHSMAAGQHSPSACSGGTTLEANRLQTAPQTTTFAAIGLLSISIRDVTRVKEVAQMAFAAGANYVVSQRSVFQDESLPRCRALEAACKEARRKADFLAESAGRKLGQAVCINELEETQRSQQKEQREPGNPGNSINLQIPGSTDCSCDSVFSSRVQAAFRLV